MKKTLKYLVPIILALLIVGSLVWFGFVYDRTFTRDLLLQQARYHSTSGNPKIGSFFYELAYEYSGQDEIVAIELANQFKSVGNYTKAEYTLSNAIADGGSAQLYIALCKTYVEQDKLLDAVNMLDNIADPEIMKQLNAMRPVAPVSDPDPGFYSQYISVSLIHDNGTLYYVLNDDYPSTEDAPYSEPFTLPEGETIVRALTVADNGLVSPLSTLGFTVGGVIEPIELNDPAIDQALHEMLQSDEDTLYSNQLWTVDSFTVPEAAESLDDIAHLPYLQSLTVSGKRIESLDFLSSLTDLKELTLTDCRFPVEDLKIISTLPNLEKLVLSDCGLSTVVGLENMNSLKVLDLSQNTVRNLEPLCTSPNLQELYLQNNAITGLEAISGLKNLGKLDVSFNSVETITPLATCKNLTWLNVNNNALTGLETAANLTLLTSLFADSNQITDISPVSACSKLQELSIARNSITDISSLSVLGSLETLDFSYNSIETLPKWEDGSPLRMITGSYNQVKSLDSLSNLHSLSYVYMDYNEIASVASLETCYNLVMVNVYGNKVTGVDKLTSHDIIVNYDPT